MSIKVINRRLTHLSLKLPGWPKRVSKGYLENRVPGGQAGKGAASFSCLAKANVVPVSPESRLCLKNHPQRQIAHHLSPKQNSKELQMDHHSNSWCSQGLNVLAQSCSNFTLTTLFHSHQGSVSCALPQSARYTEVRARAQRHTVTHGRAGVWDQVHHYAQRWTEVLHKQGLCWPFLVMWRNSPRAVWPRRGGTQQGAALRQPTRPGEEGNRSTPNTPPHA